MKTENPINSQTGLQKEQTTLNMEKKPGNLSQNLVLLQDKHKNYSSVYYYLL
jgi:hypothetical protein